MHTPPPPPGPAHSPRPLPRPLAPVQSYKLLDISISNQIWRAPVAAALLGGLLVLLFNLLSCAILIRKSIEKRGPGLGYGFVVAMCFTLAFFVLLCGLVLDGFKDVVKGELEVKREPPRHALAAH